MPPRSPKGPKAGCGSHPPGSTLPGECGAARPELGRKPPRWRARWYGRGASALRRAERPRFGNAKADPDTALTAGTPKGGPAEESRNAPRSIPGSTERRTSPAAKASRIHRGLGGRRCKPPEGNRRQPEAAKAADGLTEGMQDNPGGMAPPPETVRLHHVSTVGGIAIESGDGSPIQQWVLEPGNGSDDDTGPRRSRFAPGPQPKDPQGSRAIIASGPMLLLREKAMAGALDPRSGHPSFGMELERTGDRPKGW